MKNKRLIIEILCGVVIFVIGYSIGKQAALNRVDKTLAKVANKIGEPTTKKSTAIRTKDDIKNKKSKIYKVGEEGQSGAWNIKVLDTRETNTIDGGDGENKTTQQKFIAAHLQMTNKESAAAEYSPDDFALVNFKTKAQYNINLEAIEAANQKETIYNQNGNFFGIYDKINPNLPKQTYLVFEVPNDFNISDGVLGHVGGDKKITGYNIK